MPVYPQNKNAKNISGPYSKAELTESAIREAGRRTKPQWLFGSWPLQWALFGSASLLLLVNPELQFAYFACRFRFNLSQVSSFVIQGSKYIFCSESWPVTVFTFFSVFMCLQRKREIRRLIGCQREIRQKTQLGTFWRFYHHLCEYFIALTFRRFTFVILYLFVDA